MLCREGAAVDSGELDWVVLGREVTGGVLTPHGSWSAGDIQGRGGAFNELNVPCRDGGLEWALRSGTGVSKSGLSCRDGGAERDRPADSRSLRGSYLLFGAPFLSLARCPRLGGHGLLGMGGRSLAPDERLKSLAVLLWDPRGS